MNNMIYLVYAIDDDMEELMGLATTEEKANKMVDYLKENFSDLCDYDIVPVYIDTLIANDKEIKF